MDQDGDLKWLLDYRGDKDTAKAWHRARTIHTRIISLSRDELPFTFGLFGSWGSGKTTVLGHLAEMLLQDAEKKEGVHVIYFNAWKYAGFMEIVPAMIYKIINAAIDEPVETTVQKMARIMLFLGEKHSQDLGKWVQSKIGVNPVELYQDVLAVVKQWKERPAYAYSEIIKEYYTQLDKAQDLLKEIFPEDGESKTYVLVDELDRCDPGEAFDVIKQLRVFFAMRRIPLVFVLSVNPDPIGLAVKHQYGLDLADRASDFEAKKILEKFVDSYIDMAEPVPLKEYVEDLWGGQANIIENSLVAWLDARSVPVPYNQNTILNATMLQAITTRNYLYSNLRILAKSLDFALANTTVYTSLRWTAWHLEILKQMDEDLREAIKKVSEDLAKIAQATHSDVLRELATTGQMEESGQIKEALTWETDKGHTPFAFYRSCFWEQTRAHVEHLQSEDSSETEERVAVLKRFLKDSEVMDFVISLTAGSCRPKRVDQSRHFGWLLHASN